MKIAEELRPDGSTRYRVQHKDPARPGRYTTRRFDEKRDAAEFVRRAGIELVPAIAWDEERKGAASFRGQAGRTFNSYARSYVLAKTDVQQETRDANLADLRTIERIPSFGALRMGEITRTDIEQLKQELSALRLGNGRLMKSQTKNNLLVLVFSIIRHAAIRGDIPKDPTMDVKKFRVDDARQPCPLTIEEFDSIMVHIRPERRPLFRFLLDSGLRISEALSLTWNDIRETAHGIYEVSVWALDPSDGKTPQAQRVTTIPVETFKLLERTGDPRVFSITYGAAAGEWRRAVSLAQSAAHATKYPPLTKTPTIHDLRHSHAAFLIVNCHVNLALVAERLGHADIRVTHKYYGRLVTQQAHELGAHIARSIPRGIVQ